PRPTLASHGRAPRSRMRPPPRSWRGTRAREAGHARAHYGPWMRRRDHTRDDGITHDHGDLASERDLEEAPRFFTYLYASSQAPNEPFLLNFRASQEKALRCTPAIRR